MRRQIPVVMFQQKQIATLPKLPQLSSIAQGLALDTLMVAADSEMASNIYEILQHAETYTQALGVALDTNTNQYPFKEVSRYFKACRELIHAYEGYQIELEQLLASSLSGLLVEFIRQVGIPLSDPHTHFTGAIPGSWLYPELKLFLDSPERHQYLNKKTNDILGCSFDDIKDANDLETRMQQLAAQGTSGYLAAIGMTKLVLTSEDAYARAAYAMAEHMWNKHGVQWIDLKFTADRSGGSSPEESFLGMEGLSMADIYRGLYRGFKMFQTDHSKFDFALSQGFRKEGHYYPRDRFPSKAEHLLHLAKEIVAIKESEDADMAGIGEYMHGFDTFGDEEGFFAPEHFAPFLPALALLREHGIEPRSHHGEMYTHLEEGLLSIKHAITIWGSKQIEHGLALGIDPVDHLDKVWERLVSSEMKKPVITEKDKTEMEKDEYEILAMAGQSTPHRLRLQAIITKQRTHVALTFDDIQYLERRFRARKRFLKSLRKEILSLVSQNNIKLVVLPTSNLVLLNRVTRFKNHPFHYFDDRRIAQLGIGTDNIIALNNSMPQELVKIMLALPKKYPIKKAFRMAIATHRTGQYRKDLVAQYIRTAAITALQRLSALSPR